MRQTMHFMALLVPGFDATYGEADPDRPSDKAMMESLPYGTTTVPVASLRRLDMGAFGLEHVWLPQPLFGSAASRTRLDLVLRVHGGAVSDPPKW